MAIALEGKITLGQEHNDEPTYFAIVRNEEGWFSFEFRDSGGKTLDSVPLSDWDLREISEALAWLGAIFDENPE